MKVSSGTQPASPRSRALHLELTLALPHVSVPGRRYLAAIQDGFGALFPLLLLGSAGLLASNLPFEPLATALKGYQSRFTMLYSFTTDAMSVYLTVAVACSLARRYPGVDPLMSGIGSLAAFLLLVVGADGRVSSSRIGPQGLLVAIIAAIAAVELQRMFLRFGRVSRPAAGIPPAIRAALGAMPALCVLLVCAWVVGPLLRIQLTEIPVDLARRFISVSDLLPDWLLATLLKQVEGMFGVHQTELFGTTYLPFAEANTLANLRALQEGRAMAAVVTLPLWYAFFFGGFALPLALLLAIGARSARLKLIGRLALLPAIFGINGPILFGLPLVLAPELWLPFTLGQLVVASIAWLATATGLMSPMFNLLPWTTPAPILVWLATGGDFRAVLVHVVAYFGIGTAIYYPFFRRYDTRLLAAERSQMQAESLPLPGAELADSHRSLPEG
jgi:PTS system cellobiose-specific IIC component